jgi:putative ABC transport system permease protein
MFNNYLKIAFRNLIKNRVFAFINIFGLATGLATCLLIMLYIFDETGYDKHHKNAERIYRVASASGKGEEWAANSAPMAWGLKTDFPEIEQVTRILKFPNMDKVLMRYDHNKEKKQFFESNGYYVDSTFFQIFTYEFIYGNGLTALNEPNSLVISEQVSARLFGNENPIGKIVKAGLPFGDFNYTVKGVFKNRDIKSHIPANFFFSMRNNDIGTWVEVQNNWATNNIFHTYVKLKEGASAIAFQQKLPPFLDRRGGADLKAGGFTKRLFIQPLKDIYLHSSIGNEIAANGNIRYLYILGSIAAFILFIACINFMNLSTARSEKRAREVGVRKVMGAERGSLIRQFLGESFMMSLAALLLALVLIQIFIPVFNSLTNKNLRVFAEPKLVFWIIGLTLFTGLLSGLYPAFYLSAFKPVSVLKGKIINSFSARIIRKGLVVFQFTISVCLILGAIVIWRQLNFLNNRQLGFSKNQQVVLPLSSKEAAKNYTALKNKLLKNPHIRTVTSCSSYPGIQNVNDMLFYAEGKTVRDFVDIQLSTVENDFFETLGFKLLYGRTFSKEFTADSSNIILNEAALKQLGYEPKNAVGKKIYYDWENVHHTVTIAGVVKNFHFESLHHEIKPFGFSVYNFFGNKYNYVIANLQTDDYPGVLTDMKRSWNTINPDIPFVYSFLDQDFKKNYEKEQLTSRIVVYFTCIAILIACLGLFGLAAFSAEQRTREIGIRKVLGASGAGIVTLLSKDFIKLVFIALVIAFPIAWWVMNNWLNNFAYRIHISWWMFGLAGTIAILIAMITVSYQSVKAAIANPATSLRSE